MVEFMSSYAPSMERFEERPAAPMEQVTADIEAPIIPVGELGTTFIDQGNVLQNLENSIRMGAKKLQLVMSGSVQGVPSHGASTWGKDVRKALYEKVKATGVEITGVELSPQTMQGMSGIDQRSGRITEEGRQQSLNAVRDAVRFVADVAKGGGIDVYSQEFSRDILDASWNKDKDGKKIFYDYSQAEIDPSNPNHADARRTITKYLIDKRTGDPIRDSVIRKEEKVTEIIYTKAEDRGLVGKKDANGQTLKAGDFIDVFGNRISQHDPDFSYRRVPLTTDKGEFQVREVGWEEIDKQRQEYNKAHADELKKDGFEEGLTIEEYLYRQKLEANQALVRGQALYYGQDTDVLQAQLRELNDLKMTTKELQGKMDKEQQRKWVKDVLFPRLNVERLMPESEQERLLANKDPAAIVDHFIQREEHKLRGHQEQALSYRLQQEELEKMKKNIMTPEKYAKRKVFDSYSEAGIDAMNVTKERKLAKPIYIGPEIGMASEMYGGHPKEFIELIQQSRKEMSTKLMARGMDKEAADEAAKTHIKGMMDTSHMMMWYKHFARKPGESDEKHIKRFNEWLIDQTRDMVKAGVVGGVQVVDTITGEHAHLPAGQGAFDVVGMVKAMKEEGFKGEIISEGHGEESLGQGRILTETWRAFGAPVGNYSRGQPMGLRSWGGIQGSYFGRTNPTTYIAGAYVPSNEWQLWSETPFE